MKETDVSPVFDSVSSRLERYIDDIKLDLIMIKRQIFRIIESLEEKDFLDAREIKEVIYQLDGIAYDLAKED